MWNGIQCMCQPGAYLYLGKCYRCQAGYTYDGTNCTYSPNVQCTGSNQIAVNNVCVCQDGFYPYYNNCIKCLFPSVWNGLYCDRYVENCLAITFAMIDPGSGACMCQEGYSMMDGACMEVRKPTYMLNLVGSHYRMMP